jgi:hypothetical protein
MHHQQQRFATTTTGEDPATREVVRKNSGDLEEAKPSLVAAARSAKREAAKIISNLNSSALHTFKF